jgi:autoinducer 2-degrading protein
MWKASIMVAALAFAALLLLPAGHDRAYAQSAGLIVVVVDYDIIPGRVDDYLAAAKENGAATVKEPGCRELNISVSEKDPNHVLLFEVYDNAAALEAHRATEHFKKYAATAKDLVAKREAREFMSVALFSKGK